MKNDGLSIEGPRTALLAALQEALAFVPSRSPKPILQNIRLAAASGGPIQVMATDLETSLTAAAASIDVARPGVVLVPPRIVKILAANNSERVRLSATDRGVELVTDLGRFSSQTEPPAEYPAVADCVKPTEIKIPSAAFCEALRRAATAGGPVDQSRYALDGVRLEIEGRVATLIGTDGTRMAVCQVGVSSDPPPERIEATIPVRAVGLLRRTFSDSDDPISLVSSGSWLSVWNAARQMSCRLMEGRYPLWQNVLPKTSPEVQIECAAGPLVSMFRQVALMLDGDDSSVEIRLEDGRLSVSSHGSETSSGQAELPVSYQGETCKSNYRPGPLVSAIALFETTRVVSFAMISRKGDCMLQLATDDGFRYVQMPTARV